MNNEISLDFQPGAINKPEPMAGPQSYSQILKSYRLRDVNITSGPPVIYLESVAGCPFSCAMCKPKATKPQRVPQEVLKRLEPAFPNLEVLAIHGQGEPLMADLDYFVKQSRKHDFVLHMDTNGLLLTDEVADLLLQTRLSIRFSIHAGKPETYHKIMGVDMEKVQNNIRNLVQKSRNSPYSHDFWFSFVVMKENINEVDDFLQLAHDCGIHSVRFMHLWPNNDTLKGIIVRGMTFKYAEQSSQMVRDQFAAMQSHYKTLANQLGIKIEWGDAGNYNSHSSQKNWGELINKVTNRINHQWYFPLKHPKGICAAPWLGQFTITFKGDVLLCCLSSAILGNIFKSSLEEIWLGPRMTSIRQAFHNGYFPRECGYCRGFGLDNYPNNAFTGIKR